MELKEGMFVRTNKGVAKIVKTGRFTKIDEKGNKTIFVDKNGIPCPYEFACYVWSNKITKASFNIIDLIEVGDYVNGYKVYEIKEKCVMVGYKCFVTIFDDDEDFLYQTIYREDIKNIVTKEQFEACKYVVERDK